MGLERSAIGALAVVMVVSLSALGAAAATVSGYVPGLVATDAQADEPREAVSDAPVTSINKTALLEERAETAFDRDKEATGMILKLNATQTSPVELRGQGGFTH